LAYFTCFENKQLKTTKTVRINLFISLLYGALAPPIYHLLIGARRWYAHSPTFYSGTIYHLTYLWLNLDNFDERKKFPEKNFISLLKIHIYRNADKYLATNKIQ